MRFTPLKLAGAFLIEVERREDDRGFFARTWCASELGALGLSTEVRQCSVSFNARTGTLRGLHYQIAPNEETKLVRCTAGAIYDVLVDMRASSATFGEWIGLELTAENRRQLYVPAGMAHGFQTLQDASEVFYQISADFVPVSARGIRWNDPALRIDWPDPHSATISERDRAYPDFAFTSSNT